MTSLAVPVSVKFGRLAIENLFHTGKNILRPTRCSPTFTAAKKNLSTAAEEQKKNTAPEEQKNESSQGSTEQNISENEKKLKSEVELLTKEVEGLKEKTAEFNDKYKRALADGENMRVRLTKQIEDAKRFGIQGFCKDLLDVADILGKATESVPKDEITERNPHLKSLYEGLTMTEAQLHKAFKKHGLVSLNPLDEKFDPNQHEALFQQEVEGKAPGTVVVVSKIGYKLHERIIRPALVGVAKG